MTVDLSQVEIVDAHHHLWELGRFPYLWLAPNAPPARFGDHTSIKRNYLPAEYRADFAGFNLRGSVHVQANCGANDPVAETKWLQSLSQRTGTPNAIVAEVDLCRTDAPQLIARHAASPLLRGVRAMVAWDADGRWRFADRPGILLDPAFRRGTQALIECNLSLDLVVVPSQLTEVADLASAMPDLRIVINHLGQPESGADESGQAGNEDIWYRGIEKLKPHENVFIKASGLWIIDKSWRPDRLRPFVTHVLATFGAHRVMYGSNLPVEKVNTPAAVQIRILAEILADFPIDDLQKILSDTAKEFYRI
ncbi:amidohydrolase [Pararhizobium sp. IMCC21322]|uniref:amidohydrolase family protein n=1 Tax=Pararhizobium sp. IMCC21322 TaxID=3067903 RepID=UPI002741BEC6|nr:amidohydrolase family protein [Pararhizobium sp. IMCC21322]